MHRLSSSVVVSLLLTLSTSLANAEWDTFQGNDSHTGYVPGTVDVKSVHQLWSTSVTTTGLTDMAIGGGDVYVSSDGDFVNGFYALNATTGATTWQKSYFSQLISGDSVFSVNAPAYSNGIVYLQTSDNYGDTNFFGYNSSTGASLFTTPFGSQWEHYLNPTVYQGHVYVDGGTYGGMYSFNASTGSQDWYGYVAQFDGWTPAVDSNYCYSFTGSGDTVPLTGQFRMINRTTGTTAFLVSVDNFPLGSYTMNSAVVLGTNNDAFSIINGGSLYPTGTIGGRLIDWSTSTAGGLTPHVAWTITDGFSGQPTLANGVIYAVDNGYLSARSELDGHQLWSWQGSTSLNGPMIVTDNVLFADDGTNTYAIDLLTHQIDWSVPVTGHLALSDDTLYIATATGSVFAYSVPEPEAGVLAAIPASFMLLRRRRVLP